MYINSFIRINVYQFIYPQKCISIHLSVKMYINSFIRMNTEKRTHIHYVSWSKMRVCVRKGLWIQIIIQEFHIQPLVDCVFGSGKYNLRWSWSFRGRLLIKQPTSLLILSQEITLSSPCSVMYPRWFIKQRNWNVLSHNIIVV